MDVNNKSQSQNINFKICNSCRRGLPISAFGLLKSSKDGYNPTCLDCRRYLRNQTYHKGGYKGSVFPLRASNKKIFEEYISLEKDLYAIDLNTNHYIKLVETNVEGDRGLKIFDSEGKLKDWLVCSASINFEEVILEVLYNLRIRLIDETDSDFYTY